MRMPVARLFILGLVALLGMAALPQPARACACVGLTPEEAFDYADVVFRGQVTRIEGEPTVTGDQAIFRVDHVFKGAPTHELTIHGGPYGSGCSYQFQADTEYLVYANLEQGKLTTNICSRTAPIRFAREDLRMLDAGPVVANGFRAYWEAYGGEAIFGLPLTDEFVENGLTVQYFERARFEWHPGAWPERYDVLLGRIGTLLTSNWPDYRPPLGDGPKPGCTYFPETGNNLCAGFRSFWEEYGGLALYGYPISEEGAGGQVGHRAQWFERARFEWIPGSGPERYDVVITPIGEEANQWCFHYC